MFKCQAIWILKPILLIYPEHLRINKTVNSKATFIVPVLVSDSTGKPREVLLSFFHISTSSSANGWSVIAFVNGKEVSQRSGKPIAVGSTDFATNINGEATDLTFVTLLDWTGARRSNITFNLKFTSFDNKSLVDQIDVGPNSCLIMESVVNYSIEAIARTYKAHGRSCGGSVGSYVVTSQQLADRAIELNGCKTRKFSTNRECIRCFELAAVPFKQKIDKTLFLGLLGKVRLNILKQRENTCLIASAFK